MFQTTQCNIFFQICAVCLHLCPSFSSSSSDHHAPSFLSLSRPSVVSCQERLLCTRHNQDCKDAIINANLLQTKDVLDALLRTCWVPLLSYLLEIFQSFSESMYVQYGRPCSVLCVSIQMTQLVFVNGTAWHLQQTNTGLRGRYCSRKQVSLLVRAALGLSPYQGVCRSFGSLEMP